MTKCWYLSWFLSAGLEDVVQGMWWLDIGGYYVGAWGSCLFDNVLCLLLYHFDVFCEWFY